MLFFFARNNMVMYSQRQLRVLHTRRSSSSNTPLIPSCCHQNTVPPPQSGLERAALRSIWMLVDTDRDNRLSAHEVGCALSSSIFALSRLFAFFD